MVGWVCGGLDLVGFVWLVFSFFMCLFGFGYWLDVLLWLCWCCIVVYLVAFVVLWC